MSSARNDVSLSVVMPVHNAMPHVDDAVRSILEQTHGDFELMLLGFEFGHPTLGRDVKDRPLRRTQATGSNSSALVKTSSNICASSLPVF